MAKDLLPFMRSDLKPSAWTKCYVRRLSFLKVRRRPDAERVSLSALPHGDRYYEFGGVSGLVTIEDILELIVVRLKTSMTKKMISTSVS